MNARVKGILLFLITGLIMFIAACQKEQLEGTEINPNEEVSTKGEAQSKSNALNIQAASINAIDATYYTNDYTFTLNAGFVNGIHTSSYTIVENATNIMVHQHTFQLDTTVSLDYRENTRNLLVNDANTIASSTDLNNAQIAAIAELTKSFIGDLTIQLNTEIQGAEIFQSIFYHSSIFSMIDRKNEQSLSTCECTTNAWYLTAVQAFACTEDISFTASAVSSYYSGHYENFSEPLLDSLGIPAVIQYANEHPNESISLKKVEDLMLNSSLGGAVSQDPPSGAIKFGKCKGMDRSDIGCCGSKAGKKCRFCFDVCLVHDLVCLCCDFQICLPGCNSESFC